MKKLAKPALLLGYLAAMPFLWVGLASLAFLAGTQLWGHPAIPRNTYLWQWLEYRHDFGRNIVTSLWLAISAVLVALLLLVPFISMWMSRSSKKKTFRDHVLADTR